MWQKYFKLKGLVPGRVIVSGYGEIDFSRSDVPVETCKRLFENDFEFLEITEEGKRYLYGTEPTAEEAESEKPKKKTSRKKIEKPE